MDEKQLSNLTSDEQFRLIRSVMAVGAAAMAWAESLPMERRMLVLHGRYGAKLKAVVDLKMNHDDACEDVKNAVLQRILEAKE